MRPHLPRSAAPATFPLPDFRNSVQPFPAALLSKWGVESDGRLSDTIPEFRTRYVAPSYKPHNLFVLLQQTRTRYQYDKNRITPPSLFFTWWLSGNPSRNFQATISDETVTGFSITLKTKYWERNTISGGWIVLPHPAASPPRAPFFSTSPPILSF